MNLRSSLFAFVVVAPFSAVDAQDIRTCGTAATKQADYRGEIAVTTGGYSCQAWTAQSPHSHSNTPENRPGKGLGEHNYCRNPDGEPGAWCYTTDPSVRWQLCDVPTCSEVVNPTLAPSPVVPVTAAEISEVYDAPTQGWCVNAANGVEVDKVQKDGLFTNDADAPSVCYNFCEPLRTEPGFVGMMWRSVTHSVGARCACYFDDGYLPTTLPGGISVVVDWTSVGPVVGEGSSVYNQCYPYKAYMDTARHAVYGTGEAIEDYIELNAYGSTLQVANVEVPYDQEQNHIGKVPPTFSADHYSITAQGNTWSAWLLPQALDVHADSVLQFSFTLEQETVDGFQAVCLDSDTEETGSNGRCFVLRTTQGWIQNMVNVAEQTAVNTTSYHSIPLGYFFTGPVNYLVFIQDSDGQDRSLGRSTISDLQLISIEHNSLKIQIDDNQVEYLANNQISYSQNGDTSQDEKDYWMSPSEDRISLQVNGNQWKALPLNEPYNVTYHTLLEFDIVIDDAVDFTAICLDEDTDATGNECVVLNNIAGQGSNYHQLTTKLEVGVSHRLVIPIGSFMGLGDGETSTVNYLGFIQDNDLSARHEGRSTWSNFRLYDQTLDDAILTIHGENVTLANVQDALSSNAGDNQDSRDHIMSVSSDGRTIMASGNSWKYLTLPAPFTVGPSTVLKFDFTLYEESEKHAICLLNSAHIKDGRGDCFFTAGAHSISSSEGIVVTPYTAEGMEQTYEIIVGAYFTGEVQYIGFLIDNDVLSTRTLGQSSWSNIEVYELPALNVGLDDTTLEIENVQVSYAYGSQDNTPIKDYMATISDDNSSINLKGNMWRALELPSMLTPSSLGDMILSFDFTLDVGGEIHGICLEEDLQYGNQDNPEDAQPRRCIAMSFLQDKPNNGIYDIFLADFQTRIGESHRYVLNLKKMFDKIDYYGTEYYPKTLVKLGNNGSPSDVFPLGRCEGDCDNDSECGEGLTCFQRGGNTPVPGCEGTDSTGTDYCITTESLNPNFRYLAFVNDNDADRSVGDSTFANIAISTSAAPCLSDADFDFQLNDCTVGNFLDKVEEVMVSKGTCTNNDPLLELFGLFDATQEMDVYKEIEKICSSAYKLSQYDFADATLALDEALERQLVKEYIDGGTVMNYEVEADSTAKIGRVNDQFAASRILTMPKHHALDDCKVGAAMCCFVGSRASPVDNTDLCYTDMKASRRTAHVADGYSIYKDPSDPVYCEGFAWGTDGGSVDSALKGNALFKVGFLKNFAEGNVEQVPGAPLCGCVDRMPVVSEAACTDVTFSTSVIDVHFDSEAGFFDATLTAGDIEYGNCGGLSLPEHYDTLVGEGKANDLDAAYLHERVVGDGNCGGAINKFLAKKGLVMA